MKSINIPLFTCKNSMYRVFMIPGRSLHSEEDMGYWPLKSQNNTLSDRPEPDIEQSDGQDICFKHRSGDLQYNLHMRTHSTHHRDVNSRVQLQDSPHGHLESSERIR